MDSPKSNSSQTPEVIFIRAYSRINPRYPRPPASSGAQTFLVNPRFPSPSQLLGTPNLLDPTHLRGTVQVPGTPQVQEIECERKDISALGKIRRIPRNPQTGLSEFFVENILRLNPVPPLKPITFAGEPKNFESFKFSILFDVSDKNISEESSLNIPGGSSENIETSGNRAYSPISDY